MIKNFYYYFLQLRIFESGNVNYFLENTSGAGCGWWLGFRGVEHWVHGVVLGKAVFRSP